MRIVHLYKDYFPPTIGGIEQTVERMATYQVRQGHRVTVLTSAPRNRRTIDEVVNGVRVIRMAEWGRVFSTPFCPAMPKQLARLEADVWHHHYPSPPGEVSWLMVRPPGAMVVTYHSDIIRQKAALPVYGHFIHALLRAAEVVMPTSENQIGFSEFLPRYRDKCRVVPLGIDLAPFLDSARHAATVSQLRARFRPPIVLSVGRLVAFKGIDVMMEALAKLPTGTFVVVGDGPHRLALEERHRALGLGDRVVFAGRVEPRDVPGWMAAADVGVLPSTLANETYGLSMVEMMASGVPVVCTEVGTGTSFVNRDGESGFVIAPADSNALAKAVGSMLADDSLRRRLGEGARARATRMFSTEAMMRAVDEVYAEALARRKAA